MLTPEIFAYVRDCVSFDDEGYCLYADDLVDDVAQEFGLDVNDAADLIVDCTRALEAGRDPFPPSGRNIMISMPMPWDS